MNKYRFWHKTEKKYYEWSDPYVQDNCFNLLNGDLWQYSAERYVTENICEGDILIFCGTWIGEVKRSESGTYYAKGPRCYVSACRLFEGKKIGTIRENPELLK